MLLFLNSSIALYYCDSRERPLFKIWPYPQQVWVAIFTSTQQQSDLTPTIWPYPQQVWVARFTSTQQQSDLTPTIWPYPQQVRVAIFTSTQAVSPIWPYPQQVLVARFTSTQQQSDLTPTLLFDRQSSSSQHKPSLTRSSSTCSFQAHIRLPFFH